MLSLQELLLLTRVKYWKSGGGSAGVLRAACLRSGAAIKTNSMALRVRARSGVRQVSAGWSASCGKVERGRSTAGKIQSKWKRRGWGCEGPVGVMRRHYTTRGAKSG